MGSAVSSNCDWWDLGCKATEKIANDGIDALVSLVQEGAGDAFAALGTMWVSIPTPTVTGDGGSKKIDGSTAPGADGLNTLVGYVSWVSLIVAALSLIGMFVIWGAERRHGSQPNLARGGAIITAVMLISIASGVVTAIMPTAAAQRGTGTVAFLQQSTWWIAGGMTVISIMVSAARMAWEQRFDSGKDLARSLLTLVIVAGGGLGIIGTITTVGDGFSSWIIENATDRDFGANIIALLGTAGTSGAGQLGLLVLGFIAALSAFVQMAMMIVRGALIVVLAGGLPVAVSFTSMQAGRTFASKYIGWMIAFLVYKPAAAFVYAGAFQMVGTHAYEDDGTGLLQMISGIALLILAVLALPAILRLIVPAAAAVGGGAAMGAALGGAGAAAGKGVDLATGAMKKASSASGSSSGGNSGGGGGSGSATGSAAPSSSKPSSGGTGSGGSAGQGQAESSTAGATSGSGATSGGAAGGPTGASSAGGAAAAPTATGAGAASSGAAGGAAAGGGAAAAAGAAAGPVGIAAGAAATAIKQTAKAAQGVAVGAAEDATGESASK